MCNGEGASRHTTAAARRNNLRIAPAIITAIHGPPLHYDALRPDEARDALETVLDILRAGRVGDADRLVVAKREAGHDGDLLLVEQALGKLGRVLARGGNVD